MKAIDDYKNTIWEVSHLLFAFSFADSNDKLSKEALKKWHIDDIKKVADAVSRFHPAIDIKVELTADMPTKEALCRKLDYTFLELENDMPFGFKNWLPIFDGAYYKSDNFYNALAAINGKNWALLASMHIENIVVCANMKIKALTDFLKKLCQFAGYKGDALARRIIGDNGSKSLADEANKTKRITGSLTEEKADEALFLSFSDDDKDKFLSCLYRGLEKRLIKKDYEGKSSIRLGYFCFKATNAPRPINALEVYFNAKNLSASISQAEANSKNQNLQNRAKKWMTEFDTSIFFD